MGITNDGTPNVAAGADNYPSFHPVSGNGIAEKANLARQELPQNDAIINFNPGPAKLAPSVSISIQTCVCCVDLLVIIGINRCSQCCCCRFWPRRKKKCCHFKTTELASWVSDRSFNRNHD